MSDMGLLEHRVSVIETALREVVGEIRDGIREIAVNTGKLAVLEERHAETRDGLNRAFQAMAEVKSSISGQESRLRAVETDMPGLRETRRWVVSGVLAVLVIVGGAVITLVVNQPPVRAAAYGR